MAFSVLTGLVYPLVVTGIAQLAFGPRADGSLVVRDGVVVGSTLIGQSFAGPGTSTRVRPRPATATTPWRAGRPTWARATPRCSTRSPRRTDEYRRANGLGAARAVPVDAVTGSGSGLDPHISPANARLQARRVAEARGVPLGRVLRLVDEATEGRPLGMLGDPGVNVLELNLALDERL